MVLLVAVHEDHAAPLGKELTSVPSRQRPRCDDWFSDGSPVFAPPRWRHPDAHGPHDPGRAGPVKPGSPCSRHRRARAPRPPRTEPAPPPSGALAAWPRRNRPASPTSRPAAAPAPLPAPAATDLEPELDRSRRGTRPISRGRGGEADGRRGRRHVVRTAGLGRRRLRGRARGRHCKPAAGARATTCTVTAAPQAPRPQLFTISGPSSGSAQHAQCHIHQHSTEITENSGLSYCRQLPEDSPPTATQAGSWLFPTGFSSPSSRSRSFGGRIPDPRSPTAWMGP